MYLTYLKAILCVLDKRINVQTREQIAKGLCVFCVLVCLIANLIAQGMGKYTDETTVVTVKGNYNRLAGSHNEAVIQISKSEISQKENLTKEREVSKGDVVKNNQNSFGNEANLVTSNPKTPSLVQGFNADSGQPPEVFERQKKYQFPVEPGYPVDGNYRGRQDAGDFILRSAFPTVSENDYTGSDVINAVVQSDIFGADTAEMSASEDFSLENPPTGNSLSTDDTPPKYISNDISSRRIIPDKEQDSAEVAVDDFGVSGNGLSDTDEPNDGLKEPDESDGVQTESESVTVPDGEFESEQPVQADESFFTVNGILNEDGTIFKSNITIEPIGIKGFNQIRLGEDGEFGDSVIITKEAMEKTLQLYLFDGKTISNAVEFTYSKDTTAPFSSFDKNLFHVLKGEGQDIYCTNQFQLSVSCNDLEDGSGVTKLSYVYGDKTKYLLDHLEEPSLSLTDDFYGKMVMSCADKAGNFSNMSEAYILAEDDAPVVSTSEGSLCTVPYTLWVDISDCGNIVSGIASMECTVNGETFEIENPLEYETTEIYHNTEVVTGYRFPIVLEDTGTYDIRVNAADNAGNVTEYDTQLEVSEPELVSILMPDSFTIHIDPGQLLEREQIFSDDLVLQNMSEFDVRVNIDSINLKVKDGVSDRGIRKDCTMYLTAPDTGEKLPLEKGLNEDVYSYRLPAGAEGDIARLFFGGEVTEGSDNMWEDSDISIDVRLSFEKWEE